VFLKEGVANAGIAAHRGSTTRRPVDDNFGLCSTPALASEMLEKAWRFGKIGVNPLKWRLLASWPHGAPMHAWNSIGRDHVEAPSNLDTSQNNFLEARSRGSATPLVSFSPFHKSVPTTLESPRVVVAQFDPSFNFWMI